MEKFNLIHAKALYIRFCAIYGDKFVKSYHDEDFKNVWYNEWMTGLESVDIICIKGVLEICKQTLEWPPSIAEFRRLCEQASGVPSVDDALALAVRREFNHPIVSLAYDKVGSWAMKNDKQDVLRGKFQAAYNDALTQFRINPDNTWQILEHANEQRALPPPPPKIPSKQEIISWRERFKQYEEKSKADKLRMGEKSHPEWPKEQVTPRGRNFYEHMFNERKRYLLDLPEELAITLTNEDMYDRIRFLRELEAVKHLGKLGYTGRRPETQKEAPRRYNGTKTVYKTWMGD